jgi:hypothetical protein
MGYLECIVALRGCYFAHWHPANRVCEFVFFALDVFYR